jgi:hypothetical protein
VSAPPLPFGPIRRHGAPVTAGFFAGHGTLAVLLVKLDYRQPRELSCACSSASPEI